MLKPTASLCRKLPAPVTPQSALDNAAARIMRPDATDEFYQSSADPEPRYGIPLGSAKFLHHENPLVPNFETLGPNEQFLINKILFSPSPLLYIVGGIGVGKTTFANFVLNKILPSLRSTGDDGVNQTPCVVLVDFLHAQRVSFEGNNFQQICSDLSSFLCDQVEAAIGDRFFSFESELIEVWSDLISSRKKTLRSNQSVSRIRNAIRNRCAGSRALHRDVSAVVKIRSDIRDEISKDVDLYRSYLAALCCWIRDKVYQRSPGSFLVVIDNIDIHTPLVQHALRKVVQPFAHLSGVRTVVMVRQTSFYQRFDEGVSVPADYAPYCGPAPMDIVERRVERFIQRPDQCAYGISKEGSRALAQCCRQLIRRFFDKDPLRKMFEALCGHNIRKGLILAQRLIDNRVYDPLSQTDWTIRLTDVLRALLIGASERYRWAPETRVENIYQTQGAAGESYFTKLRILCAVGTEQKRYMVLNRLADTLGDFGYSEGAICSALNELLSKNTRLIWCDRVMAFDSMDHLRQFGQSLIWCSSAGVGYQQHLFHELDYVQEVMLDTLVNTESIEGNWDYSRLIQRLELVSWFIQQLAEQDVVETERFVTTSSAETYRRVFRPHGLLSLEILESVSRSIKNILTATETRAVEPSYRSELHELARTVQARFSSQLVLLREAQEGLIGGSAATKEPQLTAPQSRSRERSGRDLRAPS